MVMTQGIKRTMEPYDVAFFKQEFRSIKKNFFKLSFHFFFCYHAVARLLIHAQFL